MAVVGSRKHSVSLTPCRLMSDHPPGTVEERVRASADRHDGREHRITQFHHGARANRLRSTAHGEAPPSRSASPRDPIASSGGAGSASARRGHGRRKGNGTPGILPWRVVGRHPVDGLTWVKPTLTVELTYSEVMECRLRDPVYRGLG
jgi:hypothetical protein